MIPLGVATATHPRPYVYGPGVTADSVGNWFCGGAADAQVSQRFRSGKTGTVTYLRTWLKNQSGYGAGAGGPISVGFYANDPATGLPTGTSMGGVSSVDPGTAAEQTADAAATAFQLMTLDTGTVSLVAGTVYHIVYTNIAADPTADYCSVNNLNFAGSGYPEPVHPRYPSGVMATYYKNDGGSWVFKDTYRPIFDLTFSDTSHWGQGFMNTGAGYASNDVVLSGTTSMGRARFTPSATVTVAGMAVRVAKTSGTGDLIATLQTTGDATIDTATCDTADVPTITINVDSNSAGAWVYGRFAAPQTLSSGTEYKLRLHTDGSAVLWHRTLQAGNIYGFNDVTHWGPNTVVEKTTDSGSTWPYTGGWIYADMQFYFTT